VVCSLYAVAVCLVLNDLIAMEKVKLADDDEKKLKVNPFFA